MLVMAELTIDTHVHVIDADILVGVPCYRDGEMVAKGLASMQEDRIQLLIVDNGSDPDVKAVLDGRGIVVRNPVNLYVNPAWNQMMQWFLDSPQYDLLVIANSDLVLTPGWAEKLRAFRRARPQEQVIFGKVDPEHASMGAFFVMTRRVVEACCPIPPEMLIYGGDDFIFEITKRVGFELVTAEDVTMFHAVSGTIRKSPEVWEIGKRDNGLWHHHVLPKIVPARVKEFLSHR
jgi:GT2 family glycosyltransferase